MRRARAATPKERERAQEENVFLAEGDTERASEAIAINLTASPVTMDFVTHHQKAVTDAYLVHKLQCNGRR